MSTRMLSGEIVKFLRDDDPYDQYARFYAEDDTSKLKESLHVIEQLCPDRLLMLCNRSHPSLQYVGLNAVDLLGFTNTELVSMSVHDFIRRVHPEDQSGLMQCFEFINATEPYDPISYRFVLYYRFLNKGGQYIYLRDEKLAIKSDLNKYIYFTLFQNLSHEEKFFQVKLEILQYRMGNAFRVHTYSPGSNDSAITPRQHDIIRLVVQGCSTQEIADRLNISVNTVKNHKQLLFRKLNVKSSVELVNFATRHQKL